MERRNVEVKVCATEKVKREALAVYSHWGISLNEAVNMFLVKSIEVGGLPFDLRREPADLVSAANRAPGDKAIEEQL